MVVVGRSSSRVTSRGRRGRDGGGGHGGGGKEGGWEGKGDPLVERKGGEGREEGLRASLGASEDPWFRVNFPSLLLNLVQLIDIGADLVGFVRPRREKREKGKRAKKE